MSKSDRMSLTTGVAAFPVPGGKAGSGNHYRAHPLLLILVIVCAGCAGLTTDVYYGYLGEARSDAEVAIVRSVTAALEEIDGKQLKHPDPDKYYSEARMPPGPHTVTLYREFGVSVLIVPKGYVEAVSTFPINLEPGHVYELHGDRTTGLGFRVYLWIVDATTGKVVAGQKKPY